MRLEPKIEIVKAQVRSAYKTRMSERQREAAEREDKEVVEPLESDQMKDTVKPTADSKKKVANDLLRRTVVVPPMNPQ